MNGGDHELLRQYAHYGSQAAFAELVRRHVNLVYSAARRQLRSSALAEEIAQSVFIDLSRNAVQIKSTTPLVAWLHVVTRRTAIDTIRRESRRQAREQIAIEIADMKTSPGTWAHIEPLLDEALDHLSEPDRTAVLMRYFENKSLREVGAALGTSDDTAQKRVTRAIESLRAFFCRRGVTVTSIGLTADLSAHALQLAPATLGVSISATVVASGTGTAAAALAAAKTTAMTTIQKNLLAGAFALVLGTGLYEAVLFGRERTELATVQRETASLAAELRQANQRASASARQLSDAQNQLATQQSAPTPDAASVDPAAETEMRQWLERVDLLKQFARDSGKSIPELALLSEKDWLERAQNLDRERSDPRGALDEALRSARGQAKVKFISQLSVAARAYTKANNGQLPSDTRELAPYFIDGGTFKAADVSEAMLARYAMRYTGALSDVPPEESRAIIIEITSPDEEHDQRVVTGPNGSGIRDFVDLRDDTNAAVRAFSNANAGGKPASAAELLPYFKPSLSPFRQNKFLQEFPSLLPR